MVVKYSNARVVRDHKLQETDLWVSQGKIIPPQNKVDQEINVHGAIIAPGYIDIQINGGFGLRLLRIFLMLWNLFTTESQGSLEAF